MCSEKNLSSKLSAVPLLLLGVVLGFSGARRVVFRVLSIGPCLEYLNTDVSCEGMAFSHSLLCRTLGVVVKAPIIGIYFLPRELFGFLCREQQTTGPRPGLLFVQVFRQNTSALSLCIHSNPGDWMSSRLARFSLWSLLQCPSGSQSCPSVSNICCFLKIPSELVLVGFSCRPISSVVLLSDVSVIPWSTLV